MIQTISEKFVVKRLSWRETIVDTDYLDLSSRGLHVHNRTEQTEVDVEMQRNIHKKHCNFICKYSTDFCTSTDTIQRPGQLSRYSDLLKTGRSRDRIPVGVRFSAPVQTGPGAQPRKRRMGCGAHPI
jgi:hypothetical protein